MENMKGSERRWVVAHCGARDNYQLPIAMHESGQLHRFVTDWYSPLDNPLLDTLLKYAPQGVRTAFSRRYREELPSRFVEDRKLGGALYAILSRNPRRNIMDLYMNQALGERAGRAAVESGSNLLIDSYFGWSAFPQLSRDTRKVLFQIHPHPWFLREIYRKEEREMDAGSSFQSELEMRVTDELLRRWGQESLDADLVIAASSFTRRSLVSAGVKPEKILVVPYGVDDQIFRNDVDVPSGRAKALFLGQSTARKGFQHLLRAWDRIGNRGAELHIVSGGIPQKEKREYGGSVVWHDRLPLKALVALLNRVDLLVLPSVAEGFGHVLLEALSCGTPILCSDATAGSDLLTGWEEGFVFPSCDWESLTVRLDYWLSNPDRLRGLRKPAKILAEGFPWRRFRERVRNACNGTAGFEEMWQG